MTYEMMAERRKKICELYRLDLPCKAIAEDFNLHIRSVQRIVYGRGLKPKKEKHNGKRN